MIDRREQTKSFIGNTGNVLCSGACRKVNVGMGIPRVQIRLWPRGAGIYRHLLRLRGGLGSLVVPSALRAAGDPKGSRWIP
jgi:hypothetical protein